METNQEIGQLKLALELLKKENNNLKEQISQIQQANDSKLDTPEKFNSFESKNKLSQIEEINQLNEKTTENIYPMFFIDNSFNIISSNINLVQYTKQNQSSFYIFEEKNQINFLDIIDSKSKALLIEHLDSNKLNSVFELKFKNEIKDEKFKEILSDFTKFKFVDSNEYRETLNFPLLKDTFLLVSSQFPSNSNLEFNKIEKPDEFLNNYKNNIDKKNQLEMIVENMRVFINGKNSFFWIIDKNMRMVKYDKNHLDLIEKIVFENNHIRLLKHQIKDSWQANYKRLLKSESFELEYQLFKNTENNENIFLDIFRTNESQKDISNNLNNTYFSDLDNIEYYKFSFSPIFDKNNNFEFGLVVGKNITNKKNKEYEIIRNQEINKYIYNYMSDAIFILDPDNLIIIDCNQKALELFETNNKSDILGKRAIDLHLDSIADNALISNLTKDNLNVEINHEFQFVSFKNNVFLGLLIVKSIEISNKQMRIARIIDTSQIRSIQLDLIKTEREYKYLFDNAHDAIIIFEANFEIILEANQRAAEIYGYELYEMIGMPFQNLSFDANLGKEYLNHLENFGYIRNYENKHYTKKNQIMDVEINASIIDFRNKKAVLCIIRDISKRLRYEEYIQKNENFLNSILNSISCGIMVFNSKGTLLKINTYIYNIMHIDEKTDNKYLIGEYNIFYDFESNLDLINLAKELMNSNQKILKKDAYNFKIQEDDIEINKCVNIILSQIEDPIEKTNYILLNILDISEQNEIEKTNQESTRLLNAINSHLSEGIFRTTWSGKIIYANEAFVRMLACESFDELSKHNIIDFYAIPSQRDGLKRRLQIEKNYKNLEITFKRKDGSFFQSLVSSSSHTDELGNTSFDGVVLDISDYVQLNEEIKNNQKKLNAIMQNAPDLITLLDKDGIILYNSPSFYTTFDYTEEIIGKSAFNYIHPDDLVNILDVFYKNISIENALKTMEFRFKKNNGTYLILEGTGKNLLFDPAVNAVVVNSKDVTLRRENEKQLRESEYKYRLISENSKDIITLQNEKGLYTYISPSIKDALGYDESYLIGQTPFSIMHQDDIEKFKLISPVKINENKKNSIFVARLKNTNGLFIWFELNIIYIYTDNEKLIGIQTSARDIDERKKVYEELSNSESFLQNLIYSLPIGMQIFNIDGTSKLVNQALLNIFGLSLEESNKQVYNIYKDKALKNHGVLNNFELAKQGHPTFDFIFKYEYLLNSNYKLDLLDFQNQKTGFIYLNNSMIPILNQNNEVEAVVSMVQDVTKKIINEIKLDNLNKSINNKTQKEIWTNQISHDSNNINKQEIKSDLKVEKVLDKNSGVYSDLLVQYIEDVVKFYDEIYKNFDILLSNQVNNNVFILVDLIAFKQLFKSILEILIIFAKSKNPINVNLIQNNTYFEIIIQKDLDEKHHNIVNNTKAKFLSHKTIMKLENLQKKSILDNCVISFGIEDVSLLKIKILIAIG